MHGSKVIIFLGSNPSLSLTFFLFKAQVFVPGFRCENDSGCRLHTSTPELRLNPTSSNELQISYQHNFKFLISLFRGFSAPLSPVLTLHTQKNTKIKNIGIWIYWGSWPSVPPPLSTFRHFMRNFWIFFLYVFSIFFFCFG